MKKLLSFAMVLALVMPASAQITTGTPRTDNILTGNRLEAGTWGIFFGGGVNFGSISGRNFDGIDKFKTSYNLNPLVNVKYMLDDQIETRLGIEICKSKEVYAFDGSDDLGSSDYDSKDVTACMYLRPGVAYHWSKTNLLDVYVGGEVPFGYLRYAYSENPDEFDKDYSWKSSTFNIGLGAFIGLQAFVGNLPVAVGCEYGISSALYTGVGKSKYEIDGQSYETQKEFPGKFDAVKSKYGEITNKISFSISYYFK